MLQQTKNKSCHQCKESTSMLQSRTSLLQIYRNQESKAALNFLLFKKISVGVPCCVGPSANLSVKQKFPSLSGYWTGLKDWRAQGQESLLSDLQMIWPVASKILFTADPPPPYIWDHEHFFNNSVTFTFCIALKCIFSRDALSGTEQLLYFSAYFVFILTWSLG